MPRRKQDRKEVIVEGVQCVNPLEITPNRPLDCGGVTNVVRRSCILSKVISVYRDPKMTTFVRAGASRRSQVFRARSCLPTVSLAGKLSVVRLEVAITNSCQSHRAPSGDEESRVTEVYFLKNKLSVCKRLYPAPVPIKREK